MGYGVQVAHERRQTVLDGALAAPRRSVSHHGGNGRVRRQGQARQRADLPAMADRLDRRQFDQIIGLRMVLQAQVRLVCGQTSSNQRMGILKQQFHPTLYRGGQDHVQVIGGAMVSSVFQIAVLCRLATFRLAGLAKRLDPLQQPVGSLLGGVTPPRSPATRCG